MSAARRRIRSVFSKAIDLPIPAPASEPVSNTLEHIVFLGTLSGKNIAPRLTALLDVMVISEITGVVSPDTFERPIYGGNAIKTVNPWMRKR